MPYHKGNLRCALKLSDPGYAGGSRRCEALWRSGVAEARAHTSGLRLVSLTQRIMVFLMSRENQKTPCIRLIMRRISYCGRERIPHRTSINLPTNSPRRVSLSCIAVKMVQTPRGSRSPAISSTGLRSSRGGRCGWQALGASIQIELYPSSPEPRESTSCGTSNADAHITQRS